MARNPTDGKPHYCKICGCGFYEYMGCESDACVLESNGEALGRVDFTSNKPHPRNYTAEGGDHPGHMSQAEYRGGGRNKP